MIELVDPTTIKTFKLLEDEFNKVLLLNDPGFVRLLCAVTCANQMDIPPIWMMFVTASSGGKSEIINTLNGLSFIFPISDLTVNTFASGQKLKGKTTSMLHKMPLGAIMTFKDFTSLLSKNEQARTEILGQLREIFDGKYDKLTGSGVEVHWKGRVGAIGGVTEIIYEYTEALSSMGDRFIMYNVEQPERLAMAKRQMGNNDHMGAYRDHLQACMKNYIEHVLAATREWQMNLSESIKEDLLHVADFATRVRSGVVMDDRKGIVKFAPTAEMPTRMTSQLYSICTGLMMMNNADTEGPIAGREVTDLTAEDAALCYKIAFSSIPIKRRMALMALAKYRGGVTTAGLAVTLNYETSVVRQWLSQLNSLGICDREKRLGPQGDKWRLNEAYRDIIVKFQHIEIVETELEDEKAVAREMDDFYEERDKEEKAAEESYQKGALTLDDF